jgi:hypothetical protein
MVGSSYVAIRWSGTHLGNYSNLFWQRLLDAWAIFEEMNVLSMQVL